MQRSFLSVMLIGMTTTLLCSCTATSNLATLPAETELELNKTIENPWFADGQGHVDAAIAMSNEITNEPGAARNLILFVGDGMGISTITAARIYTGQAEGGSGEEYSLAWGKFPFSGLVKTYTVNAQTPDSAGTMTAMASGAKTDTGVLGVSEAVERGQCDSAAGNELLTSLELAEIIGLSTGIVSTARITHATPAANYAKSADRNWEDDSKLPTGSNCEDIASQLIGFESNLSERYPGASSNGIEVVMGGGRRHFLPNIPAANSGDEDSEIEGDRTDGRHLVEEWQAQYPDGTYVMDSAGFNAVDTAQVNRVFGLFSESHMRYEANRDEDKAGEPSLAEMTKKAIEILDDNQNGYLLIIEGGRVDHAHHANNAFNALNDARALSHAVQVAVDSTSDDTLIMVTADHSHTFTLSGYPKRGNPILGKVVGIGESEYKMAEDGLPYTTLGYRNGRGAHDLGDETNADLIKTVPIQAGRVDLSTIDTTNPGFHQATLVPRGSETHGGEDVGVYATGPGAHLISGTIEQSVIFHVMNHAGNLLDRAQKKLSR